jgi:hypothetical protein
MRIEKETSMKKGCLHIVRGDECKITLPGPCVTIKTDGTIWSKGCPILGISDPTAKAKYAECARRKAWNEIPAEYYTKIGDNANGLWAGWTDDYAHHPVKIASDEQARKVALARAARDRVWIKIHLSTRGWGDYSSVEWHGDITRPDAEIIEECQKLLKSENDVDIANQTDAEILKKIMDGRTAWTRKQTEQEAPETETHGPGYCYSCDSYCFGDCGDYQPHPTSKTMMRELGRINAEINGDPDLQG